MNNYFFSILTFCLLAMLTNQGIQAQNSLRQADIKTETKGKKEVLRVQASQVKSGKNVIKLDSGDLIEFEIKNDKLKRLSSISNGIKKNYNLPVHGSVEGFQCNSIFCQCEGDVDCNDMFSGDNCGCCVAVCIDTPDGKSICFCNR